VLTCSALKRSYRDLLRADLPAGSVYFVHLAAPREVLQERMETRSHFMPASLLQSQLDTLEPLGPDEAGRCFDVTPPANEVCDAVVDCDASDEAGELVLATAAMHRL
jgi:gluconokinase